MITTARLPGYSAEKSLGRAGAGGYSSPTAMATGVAAVVPQAAGARSTAGPCDPTCLCITGEGCPCCAAMPPEFLSISKRGSR
jgi:hypothetical protein